MKVGIVGRNDFWKGLFEEEDYRVIREARIELVLMFEYTRPEVFRRLRNENPTIDFIVKLYDAGEHGTPATFVERHALKINELRPYATKFEILNEPNFPGEGWGPSLDEARIFNNWYLETLGALRQRFPWTEFGFPGLSPAMLPGETVLDTEWVEVCRPAVEASDWLGCHCYWSDLAGMRHTAFGLRFTKYHRLFPSMTIHITEFNNDLGRINNWQRALQYEEYYKTLGEYPYIASASAFLISSPDPHWAKLAWWDPDLREMRPVVWKVGSIPRPIAPPVEAPAYAVEYLSHNTPRAMVAGQTNAVHFTIKNTSRQTWRAEGVNRVRLGYHWYYPDGTLVPSTLWRDIRTPLPHDLLPGESVTFNAAEVGAPRKGGAYVLKWDMVEEMVTWFAWQGVPTLDISVNVTAEEVPERPGVEMASASHNNVTSGPDNLLQALDDSPATRWSTRMAQRPGMWFRLDLGQARTVGRVALNNDGSPRDYPRGYTVKVSADGINWDTVASNPQNDRPLDVSFPPRPLRYLLVEQTGSDPIYWWSIHDVSLASPWRREGAQ